MGEIGLALQLMATGMITVFVILGLVVVIGNLIIRFVNKYLPEEEIKKAMPIVDFQEDIGKKKIAAIVSAVRIVTEGKGHISKIEKL